MNHQLTELEEAGLQQITGGTIPWGFTLWGLAAAIIANWADIKQGIDAGWTDQQHPNPYQP